MSSYDITPARYYDPRFKVGWNRGMSTVWLKEADFNLYQSYGDGSITLKDCKITWTKYKNKADGIPINAKDYFLAIVRELRKEGRDVFIEDC